MKDNDIIEIFDRAEAYDNGVTILKQGSIERAMEIFIASNPRWQFCTFAQLPRTQQIEVLSLAEGV